LGLGFGIEGEFQIFDWQLGGTFEVSRRCAQEKFDEF
jgi:hypothetical protein